jgi:hypothetical protein
VSLDAGRVRAGLAATLLRQDEQDGQDVFPNSHIASILSLCRNFMSDELDAGKGGRGGRERERKRRRVDLRCLCFLLFESVLRWTLASRSCLER